MEWISEFASALKRSLEASKSSDSNYSLRKFAVDIGVPPSTLSELMRGNAVLTPLKASIVLDRLNLNREERNYLLATMKMPIDLEQQEFENADYAILTDWTYLAILHFFELDDCDKSSAAISERLLIPEQKVEFVLSDLITRGLLVKSDSGEISSTGKNWTTSDGPPRTVVRQHHGENLDSAKRALEALPTEERDFTTSTFAGSAEQIARVREEIRELHRRVEAIAEGGGKKDRVLRLTVGYFPLDRK